MKIGYDRKLTTELSWAFIEAGSVKNYTRAPGDMTDLDYFERFLLQHAEHEIILNSLNSISSCTIIQLNRVLTIIEDKNIVVTFLDPSIGGVNIKQSFLEVVRAYITHEKHIMSNRTTKGIEVARSEGRIGGRPEIPVDLQKEIIQLHFNQKKVYREIAEELKISIGTVHKYLKKK